MTLTSVTYWCLSITVMLITKVFGALVTPSQPANVGVCIYGADLNIYAKLIMGSCLWKRVSETSLLIQLLVLANYVGSLKRQESYLTCQKYCKVGLSNDGLFRAPKC